MPSNEIVVRFDKVNFEYGHNKHILEEVSFSLRKGMKVALMGQNGAGKSTIFGLITGALQPEAGDIHIGQKCTIAQAMQVIPRNELDLSVRDFFQKRFPKKIYAIDPMIDDALEVVNLKGHEKVHERKIRSFSGGQQARLLLASAIIQDPDILLLDEPTNNLDKAGIEHLTQFLKNYQKTVVVISHDADFLNAFTDGVLYLDVFTRKIEQYAGNYNDVVRQISARIDKENKKNTQLAKEIQAKKDQANAFAHKGGRLRLVAKRMKNLAAELEEEMVDVRQEDRTIRPFVIPIPEDFVGEAIKITSFTTLGKNHKPVTRKAHVTLRKGNHLLLKGPNGIGKTTLLESIANGTAKGAAIAPGVKVGYYRQDFSTLNFEDTVYQSLMAVLVRKDEEYMRSVAAGFLITSEVINTKIGSLSEGQKGLVAFARLVLEKPSLLILDEPTNHINFRHLPLIAEALNKYQGAMILVSHVPEFVEKIRMDEVLDLEK
jgi:ATP-binding cassette subfamily F protein 3